MAQTLIWSHEALDDIDRIAEHISRDSLYHTQQVAEGQNRDKLYRMQYRFR